MEEKTYYYLYQITNKLNGKIYVGVHRTKNLDDGYMGSGLLLNESIKKDSIENFEKTILKFFDNVEDMFKEESKIVDKEFLLREDVYNLNIGGYGGWPISARQNSHKNNLINKLGIHSPESKAKSLETRRRLNSGVSFNPILRDRARTSVARLKRKETFEIIEHQKGEKNSQFGTMWITNGTENKKIDKNEPIPDGWLKGRKIKS